MSRFCGLQICLAILFSPTFEMPEALAIHLIDVISPIVDSQCAESEVISALEIIQKLLSRHPLVVMEVFTPMFWRDVITCVTSVALTQRILQILICECRDVKMVATIEFSEAVVDVLAHVISQGPDTKELIIAVTTLAYFFAHRNQCWPTLFEPRGLLPELLVFFHFKSATVRQRVMGLLCEAFKQPTIPPDIFDLSLILDAIEHRASSAIQSGAIKCIECYIRNYPEKIDLLREAGLVQRLMAVLDGGGFYTAQGAAIDLIHEMVLARPDEVDLFAEVDILAAMLPRMKDSVDTKRIMEVIHILERVKQVCVAVGLQDEFLAKFSENDGYDILEGFLEGRAGCDGDVHQIIQEDARLLLHEIDYIGQAIAED
jgi:hypothetical protein